MVLPACSTVWRMVSTKMSPERPVLGTMSTTSAFFTAGSPARRRSMIWTRRPAPMRRGIGIGGSTRPLLGWPSGPSSLCTMVSPKKTVNQCGGRGSPRLMLSGSTSKVAATRRTAIMPMSSSTVRTRPIQGRSSTIASSIQPIVIPSHHSYPLPSEGERLGEGYRRTCVTPSPNLSPWRGRGERRAGVSNKRRARNSGPFHDPKVRKDQTE